MSINLYPKGQMVRLSAAFADADGNAVDPSTVQVEYRAGSGEITTLLYGTDADLVKDSAGNYHADVPASSVGNYYWRWSSTGTGQAAAEGVFMVSQSAFD